MARLGGLALAAVLSLSAQTDWRRIGTSAVESNFAGPTTGPVTQAWFAADGSRLYALTRSNKIFETQDFENWAPAETILTLPPDLFPREPVRKPDPSARYFAINAGSRELWGVGQQLYHSTDGKSWETLTLYKAQSVIGGGLSSVAVSPTDPSQIVVANEGGVWRSMDAGLTWASLNQLLPNLSIQRIIRTPSGGHSAQIQTENQAVLDLLPGTTVWRPFTLLRTQLELELKKDYSAKVQGTVSAFAASRDNQRVYAGTEDGRIWLSVDSGASFRPLNLQFAAAPGHRVERLLVSPENPNVALAVFSGEGAHVIRTISGGNYWDTLDSASLPAVPVHGVTADQASGAIYVATDKGVYWTHFEYAVGVTPNNLTWTSLTENLPAARAMDVMLDPAGVQLYAALEGYGVYGAPAPHRFTGLRLVNAADYSNRAASPGSLVAVFGEKVNSVTGGGRQFPVWSSSQFQVPFEAVGPSISLALDTASGRMTRDLPVQPVSPAIFVGTDGVPVILDADSGMPLDHNVAHPGQRLQVLLTGLGRVTPDWQTGVAPPKNNPPAVVARVQAFLDRGLLPVSNATLAEYPGYYVVEVQLPAVTNYGAMELHIAADGLESNRVQIVIAQ